LIDGLREILQPPDVTVLPEDAFHRHICRKTKTSTPEMVKIAVNNPPICRMAETTSSIKLGTLRVARLAPNKESEPSFSTRSSRGTPKTPNKSSVR
jgi:hypothetical protein